LKPSVPFRQVLKQ